ncbi:hypothetical protein PQX77_007026 [Marasmius sp. AFHP31]|nr:hypothetical protein PQX77_007026 [Marasmius sp. AFHP31]
MEGLPIDMRHPAVREYLSLIRLQVLTPLSLLVNIATVIICAVVVNPSLGSVARRFPTSISPKPLVVAVYVAAIFLGQIGYCLLLVLVRKPETKKTLTSGVGLALVFANWVMALWAVSWVFEWFLFSTILQGLLLLLLLYSNIVLLVYHRPTRERIFDTMLIHAPIRFFLVLQIALMFPLSLFITLGLTYHEHPIDYTAHQWPGFGVVFGTNMLGLIVIIFRRDIVWCVAATWVCVSIWAERPKPSSVYATVLLFTFLHPVALFGTYVYAYFFAPEERAVELPPDDEHPGLREKWTPKQFGDEGVSEAPIDKNLPKPPEWNADFRPDMSMQLLGDSFSRNPTHLLDFPSDSESTHKTETLQFFLILGRLRLPAATQCSALMRPRLPQKALPSYAWHEQAPVNEHVHYHLYILLLLRPEPTQSIYGPASVSTPFNHHHITMDILPLLIDLSLEMLFSVRLLPWGKINLVISKLGPLKMGYFFGTAWKAKLLLQIVQVFNYDPSYDAFFNEVEMA